VSLGATAAWFCGPPSSPSKKQEIVPKRALFMFSWPDEGTKNGCFRRSEKTEIFETLKNGVHSTKF